MGLPRLVRFLLPLGLRLLCWPAAQVGLELLHFILVKELSSPDLNRLETAALNEAIDRLCAAAANLRRFSLGYKFAWVKSHSITKRVAVAKRVCNNARA